MKVSDRNFIQGKIVDVEKGATTSIVHLEIGGGVILTASITDDSVEDLKLEKGNTADALIKSSDVMIAVN